MNNSFLDPENSLIKISEGFPVPAELFTVEGRPAFLITPSIIESVNAIPWVWYAPTLPDLPGRDEKWMFEKFLNHGIAIAGIDVGESYGSPEGRNYFTALYRELTETRNLAQRACLLARSRGGLMLYNWAAEHPLAVACIAGIYPVGDLRSYPGLDKACKAYGMTEQQLTAELEKNNPISRLEPIARANVPIFHIHGDNDLIVPLENNSAVIEQRYKELNGEMTLEIVLNGGHDHWDGWFQCQPLVDFIISHV